MSSKNAFNLQIGNERWRKQYSTYLAITKQWKLSNHKQLPFTMNKIGKMNLQRDKPFSTKQHSNNLNYNENIVLNTRCLKHSTMFSAFYENFNRMP